MLSETQLTSLLIISTLIWIIILSQKGIPLSFNDLEPFSTVTTVLLGLLKIFDRFLWKWKIFYPWLVDIPNLQGTWKGSIKSTWENPNSNKNKESILSFLVIKQSFSKINAKLITKESKSDLISGKIVKDPDGNYELTGIYINSPRILNRKESPIHRGAIILTFKGNPPSKLAGEYWTDRNTAGELIFKKKKKVLVDDFPSGEKLFNIREKKNK